MATELWTALTPAGESFLGDVDLSSLLLATDFDGSIADIVDDPEHATMHDGCADALAALGGRVAALAIITGRGVEAVRRLGRLDARPGFESVIVLGQYGVERWDAGAETPVADAVPNGVAAATGELRALVDSEPSLSGVRLEDKGRSVGVHTRRSPDPAGALERLQGPVSAIAQAHGLHVEPGKLVLELRASSLNKGDALRALTGHLRPRFLVMIGDDLGDLPAFEALRAAREDGLTCCAVVSASDEQPALRAVADVECEGPAGVAAWLNALAAR